jgi:hypothetical protein
MIASFEATQHLIASSSLAPMPPECRCISMELYSRSAIIPHKQSMLCIRNRKVEFARTLGLGGLLQQGDGVWSLTKIESLTPLPKEEEKRFQTKKNKRTLAVVCSDRLSKYGKWSLVNHWKATQAPSQEPPDSGQMEVRIWERLCVSGC